LPKLIKDCAVLGLDAQVLIMYWCMVDLWGLVNLVAYVTAWSNRNCYSKVVVRWRMRQPKTTARSGDHRGTKISSRVQRSEFDLIENLRRVAVCKVQETVHTSCCQVFPCKVYIDLNLHGTFRHE
jgi:hypothetical protein